MTGTVGFILCERGKKGTGHIQTELANGAQRVIAD